jgi:hypothetical protein
LQVFTICTKTTRQERSDEGLRRLSHDVVV